MCSSDLIASLPWARLVTSVISKTLSPVLNIPAGILNWPKTLPWLSEYIAAPQVSVFCTELISEVSITAELFYIVIWPGSPGAQYSSTRTESKNMCILWLGLILYAMNEIILFAI